jgi:hypothetical protein
MGVGGQRHTPAAILPGLGTLCTAGWVGLRAGLDGCGKSRPCRYSILEPSSPQQVDPGIALQIPPRHLQDRIFFFFRCIIQLPHLGTRDSVVDYAVDWTVWVSVPGREFSLLPNVQACSGTFSFMFVVYRGSLLRGQAAVAWSLTLISIKCRD